MFIKQFTRGYTPVPDPLHPSRTVPQPKLVAVPVTSFVYTDASGARVELEPVNEDGWFDVPHDVATAHLPARSADGTGWYSEREVAEEVRLGRSVEETQRPARRPRRGRHESDAEQAERDEG